MKIDDYDDDDVDDDDDDDDDDNHNNDDNDSDDVDAKFSQTFDRQDCKEFWETVLKWYRFQNNHV